MPFDLKENAATAGLPAITLAGQQLYVPRATLGQVLDLIEREKAIDAVMAKFDKALAAKSIDQQPEFTAAEFLPLLDAVRLGLLPLYPGLTVQDLRDATIDLPELIVAVRTVRYQASSRRVPSGEPGAAGPQPQPTGAASPPISS